MAFSPQSRQNHFFLLLYPVISIFLHHLTPLLQDENHKNYIQKTSPQSRQNHSNLPLDPDQTTFSYHIIVFSPLLGHGYLFCLHPSTILTNISDPPRKNNFMRPQKSDLNKKAYFSTHLSKPQKSYTSPRPNHIFLSLHTVLPRSPRKSEGSLTTNTSAST